jgi:hypothetical protein
VKPDRPVFDKVWRADCLIERIGRAEGDAMIKRHYIGKWPGIFEVRRQREHTPEGWRRAQD